MDGREVNYPRRRHLKCIVVQPCAVCTVNVAFPAGEAPHSGVRDTVYNQGTRFLLSSKPGPDICAQGRGVGRVCGAVVISHDEIGVTEQGVKVGLAHTFLFQGMEAIK